MNGAELIAAERRRQIDVEHWTPEHDAEHEGSELLDAAACYLLAPSYGPEVRDGATVAHGPNAGHRWAPTHWPWESLYWKPTPDDRAHELVKAGALIAAEIDRLSGRAELEGEQR